MMDGLGIIHMNGRIYDPTLGRFLQADPHIQAPMNSQNYNRYSYVLNNPMSYTDPSGYLFNTDATPTPHRPHAVPTLSHTAPAPLPPPHHTPHTPPPPPQVPLLSDGDQPR